MWMAFGLVLLKNQLGWSPGFWCQPPAEGDQVRQGNGPSHWIPSNPMGDMDWVPSNLELEAVPSTALAVMDIGKKSLEFSTNVSLTHTQCFTNVALGSGLSDLPGHLIDWVVESTLWVSRTKQEMCFKEPHPLPRKSLCVCMSLKVPTYLLLASFTKSLG